MNNLDELKNKKLEQLRKAYAEQAQNQAKERQEASQLEIVEEAVKAHFTRQALQRFGAIKLAHPETATGIVVGLAHLIEAGRLTGMLDDEQLADVARQISSSELQKRQTRIIRK